MAQDAVGSNNQEQSFATGRISVPLVLSGETPNVPEYDFLYNEKAHYRNVFDNGLEISKFACPVSWKSRCPLSPATIV